MNDKLITYIQAKERIDTLYEFEIIGASDELTINELGDYLTILTDLFGNETEFKVLIDEAIEKLDKFSDGETVEFNWETLEGAINQSFGIIGSY